MSKQKCKKLGNHATKRERAEAHRAKMEIKRIEYETMREDLMTGPQPWVFANLSRDHEFYGDTPREHEERKRAENNS